MLKGEKQSWERGKEKKEKGKRIAADMELRATSVITEQEVFVAARSVQGPFLSFN